MNDAITHLVRLRAEISRLAHEVEAIPSYGKASKERARLVANWLIDAVMNQDIVNACKRTKQ